MACAVDQPAEDVIRPEGPPDFAAIADVVRRAFRADTEVALVEAIRRLPGYLPDLSLVAEVGERIVGHVMISRAELDDGGRRHPVATLSPLAVDPDHQRRGIGSALVRAVTARADAAGIALAVLEGSPLYYSRFGFEPSLQHGVHIDLPSWAPPEAGQVLRLSRYDPSLRGRLVFAALDQVEGPE